MKRFYSGRSLVIIPSRPIIFLTALAVGCENDGGASENQIQYIDFEIVIMAADQKQATVFAPGTDINAALKVINNSGSELEWTYDYTCSLLQTENFMLVYQQNEGESREGDGAIGFPYQPPIYCPTINRPPQRLPPGETILIKLPWSANPDNHPLLTGSYYVVADFSVTINGQSRNWVLRTAFHISVL